MGLTRFLLALSILIHHGGSIFGYTLLARDIAIRSFFIISGFYMALILSEKYKNKSNGKYLFLTNRFLRIYPVYWVVLLLTILMSYIWFALGADYGMQHYAANFDQSNGFIFPYASPIDILRDVTILFRSDYLTLNPNYAEYLVINQAWTLVLELIFYIIAPFIIARSNKTLFVLILFSLIIRLLVFAYLRSQGQPVTDRFFPAELAFFLFGVIAYRIYAKLKNYKLKIRTINSIAVIFIVITVLYPFIPIHTRIWLAEIKDWLYLALLTLAIPFLFLATSKNSIDHVVGDISYPLYISHMLLLLALTNLGLNNNTGWFTIFFAIVSIVFSLMLIWFIDKPINVFRQQRVQKTVALAQIKQTSIT